MVQKALMYKATMRRLKSFFFIQSTLLFNNLVLTSYLRGILTRIKVFLVMGRSPERKEEKQKRKEENTEEKL